MLPLFLFFFFFFNDPATTEIYTLSLHDALPILVPLVLRLGSLLERLSTTYLACNSLPNELHHNVVLKRDRKSTRLNSSHANISYAVFCLKKKKKKKKKKIT